MAGIRTEEDAKLAADVQIARKFSDVSVSSVDANEVFREAMDGEESIRNRGTALPLQGTTRAQFEPEYVGEGEDSESGSSQDLSKGSLGSGNELPSFRDAFLTSVKDNIESGASSSRDKRFEISEDEYNAFLAEKDEPEIEKVLDEESADRKDDNEIDEPVHVGEQPESTKLPKQRGSQSRGLKPSTRFLIASAFHKPSESVHASHAHGTKHHSASIPHNRTPQASASMKAFQPALSLGQPGADHTQHVRAGLKINRPSHTKEQLPAQPLYPRVQGASPKARSQDISHVYPDTKSPPIRSPRVSSARTPGYPKIYQPQPGSAISGSSQAFQFSQKKQPVQMPLPQAITVPRNPPQITPPSSPPQRSPKAVFRGVVSTISNLVRHSEKMKTLNPASADPTPPSQQLVSPSSSTSSKASQFSSSSIKSKAAQSARPRLLLPENPTEEPRHWSPKYSPKGRVPTPRTPRQSPRASLLPKPQAEISLAEVQTRTVKLGDATKEALPLAEVQTGSIPLVEASSDATSPSSDPDEMIPLAEELWIAKRADSLSDNEIPMAFPIENAIPVADDEEQEAATSALVPPLRSYVSAWDSEPRLNPDLDVHGPEPSDSPGLSVPALNPELLKNLAHDPIKSPHGTETNEKFLSEKDEEDVADISGSAQIGDPASMATSVNSIESFVTADEQASFVSHQSSPDRTISEKEFPAARGTSQTFSREETSNLQVPSVSDLPDMPDPSPNPFNPHLKRFQRGGVLPTEPELANKTLVPDQFFEPSHDSEKPASPGPQDPEPRFRPGSVSASVLAPEPLPHSGARPDPLPATTPPVVLSNSSALPEPLLAISVETSDESASLGALDRQLSPPYSSQGNDLDSPSKSPMAESLNSGVTDRQVLLPEASVDVTEEGRNQHSLGLVDRQVSLSEISPDDCAEQPSEPIVGPPSLSPEVRQVSLLEASVGDIKKEANEHSLGPVDCQVSIPEDSDGDTPEETSEPSVGPTSSSLVDRQVSLPECYVVVHNVAKKHNIGTLVRSATAFGVKQMVLIGRRDFNSFGSHGTTEHVDFKHCHSLAEAQKYLKEKGCEIVGVEIADGARPVHSHPFRGNTAFLLGNEGSGLSEKEMALCDSFVYIPQHGGGTASLNVTVAASIILHHFAIWAGYSERSKEGQKFVVAERPVRRAARNVVPEDPAEVAERRRLRAELAQRDWLEDSDDVDKKINIVTEEGLANENVGGIDGSDGSVDLTNNNVVRNGDGEDVGEESKKVEAKEDTERGFLSTIGGLFG